MKKRFQCWIAVMLAALLLSGPVYAESDCLIPVGKAVGLDLETDGVYLIRFEGESSPAQAAGLKIGDRIVSVNGRSLHHTEELQSEIRKNGGRNLIVDVERNSRPMSFTVQPVSVNSAWQIGVLVQDRITGLGTVTFYNPKTGLFGALGHGVNQNGSGMPMNVSRGKAIAARVADVQKGAPGTPGSLKGAAAGRLLGIVEENTPQGIFGHAARDAWTGSALPVAGHEEITTGPAEIWSTVDGDRTDRYSVDIEALSFGADQEKNMCLLVTDPRLLDLTGGIVQGMSGSPIIQNGRLIGAVTHVLIQDPTRGYGIFIENMLAGYQRMTHRDAA